MTQKGLLLLVYFLLNAVVGKSQIQSGTNEPAYGPYDIGFNDTIAFNEEQIYQYHSYNGAKPYLIGIWFPLNDSGSTMRYRDYFDYPFTRKTKAIRDSIRQRCLQTFIDYGVTKNLDTWENAEQSNLHEQLAEAMMQKSIPAMKAKLPNSGKYPVIVYHHGSGGTIEENAFLFEWLASYGYVVVSANYHWPTRNTRIENGPLETVLKDVEFIIGWSVNLSFTDGGSLYYMGHSWGGQTGLILNHTGSEGVERYILLDTSIEGMPTDWIKKIYPAIDSIFSKYPDSFQTETTIITSQSSSLEEGEIVLNPYPEFEIFQIIDDRKFEYHVMNESLNHDSFLSQGVMRAEYAEEYPQPDSTTVKSQYSTYFKLNEVILSILKGEVPDPSLVDSFKKEDE